MAFFAYIINVLFGLFIVLRVGVAMAKRGRKPILKNKRTTCITAEDDDFEYLKEQGIEASEFFRKSVDALRKSKSSPIEQLKKEIEETRATILGYEIILKKQEEQLRTIEEQAEIDEIKDKEMEEFEEKKRNYVIGCTKMMQNSSWNIWNKHLMEAWKFTTLDDAKHYVKNVWLDIGVPENKIDKFLGIN